VKTVAVYLLRLGLVQLHEVTVGDFTVLKNVLQKALAPLKKSHASIAENFFTPSAHKRTRTKKHVQRSAKQSFSLALTRITFKGVHV
jgi:hypothetical protein